MDLSNGCVERHMEESRLQSHLYGEIHRKLCKRLIHLPKWVFTWGLVMCQCDLAENDYLSSGMAYRLNLADYRLPIFDQSWLHFVAVSCGYDT